MKKHIIAAAVAAAVAAPAMAQNVTVYGRIDGGYGSKEAVDSKGVTTKTEAVGFSNFTTSRLGFSGSDDLGGGLKAAFTVEGNINPNGGQFSSNTKAADQFNFGRQTWASLSGGFGTVLVGKIDAGVKSIYDNYDAGYTNNVTGTIDSFTDGKATALAGFNGMLGNRRDAVIRYTSPTFSNTNVSVGILKASTNVDNKDPKQAEDNTGYEAGATYAAGPLSVGLAYRSATTKVSAVDAVAGVCATKDGSAVTNTGADGGCASTEVQVSGNKAADATNTRTNTIALGASYNFGPAIGFAQYFDQSEKEKNAGTKVDYSAYAVGVRVPVGAANVFASYADGKVESGGSKYDQRGYQLGVKYDLSKRTYGYVVYGDREEKKGAAKVESTDVVIGVAHHF